MAVAPQNNLDGALETFVHGAGKISSALLGMVNKVGGQIYALLFLSEDALSLDEIAEKLHVSKSSVSINVRMLEERGLVKKIWVKGSRRDFYVAERVYPKKVLRDFLEKVQRTITEAIAIIEKTREEIVQSKSTNHKKRAEFMLEQLNLINSFYLAAQRFFDDFFTGKPINIDLLRHVILNPEDLK